MKRLPNGYLIFSAHMRRLLQEDEDYKSLSFGEISRIVGVKVMTAERETKSTHTDSGVYEIMYKIPVQLKEEKLKCLYLACTNWL